MHRSPLHPSDIGLTITHAAAQSDLPREPMRSAFPLGRLSSCIRAGLRRISHRLVQRCPRFLSPALFAAVVLPLCALASNAAAIELAEGSTARLLPISADAFAGSSVNVVAGVQHTLFTDRSTQLAAFYAGDGVVTLARRNLGEDIWHTQRTACRGRVNDAHNNIAIAVDGDGFLHVAWDHHASPLRYTRAVAPGSLELEAEQAMTKDRETSVTYPQFHRLPDGDLLFFYRDGRSGRGDLVLNRYATRTRSWTRVQSRLIDGEGQRSAYPSATVDRRGVIHLAWNWRDSADVATNHDLLYAKSTDGGVTWSSASGAALTLPLTAASDAYALRIGPGRSLMNPPSITVDQAGRPVLASYWCPEGSDVPQYHIAHFNVTAWRAMQVTQRTTPFVLAGTATKRPPLSRSVLFAIRGWRKPQEMHLAYRDDERGGRIVLASSRNFDATTPTWILRDLTATGVGAWEPGLDPEQALRLDQLHLLVQVVEQRDGNDREVTAAPPSPIASLLWSPFSSELAEQRAKRVQATPAAAPASAATPTAPPDPGAVLALLHRVSDWQLQQPYPPARDPRGWEIAPFYMGLLAVDELTPAPRYRERLRAMFEKLDWAPGPRVYDADDVCVTQAYLSFFEREKLGAALAPSRQRLDAILAAPPTSRLEWGVPGSRDRWSWADALFMGPASWLGVARATGDTRYAEFAHREWWATTAALFRPGDGWFARDESFLDLREPNGRALYWSRGNGWVAAGLVNVFRLLPPDDPQRPRYLALYRRMMEAALAAQQPDGLWRPGLLDPVAHPARETSGSAFLTYAMAWGIRHDLLDRAVFGPAVVRAWAGLAACVTPEGKLEHVQPIGAAPEGFDPGHNDWFGVGAFLLAGSEIHHLHVTPAR